MSRRAVAVRVDREALAEPLLLSTQIARAAATPEAALACAVIEQARADLAARAPRTLRNTATVERAREAARSWVADETESGLFSFTWWCHACGADPDAVRAAWRRTGLL